MTDEERAEYRERKRQDAEQALDRLLTQEGWSTWLRLRRSLHEYSWTNQVLIAQQAYEQATAAAAGMWARDGWQGGAPDTPCAETPTLVKAAGRWKRDGYHPAKGTRGLYVWAFHSRRRKDGVFACCGILHRPDQRNCTDCGRPDHYFKLAPVFDASQVRSFETGEPPAVELPPREPITGDDLGWMLEPLAEWALEGPVATIDLQATSEHGERGSWNPQTRHLRVCLHIAPGSTAAASDNARLRVLLHELAHAHGVSSRNDRLDLSYGEAEVAVECVSYMVAATAGLDTSGEAIPYMAGWGGEDARAKVRALAALIDQTAKTIEQPIVQLLAERNELVPA
ncbi:MAG: hypothetical protein ACRDM7_15940 [Thermoleophilaceae bacterium]